MKKIVLTLGSLGLSLILLVAMSSRRVGELFGYVKATADHTVEGLEDNVPNAIRDQKLQNDIEQARGEIIDRRVKLNLASSEIRRMQDEIDQLSAASNRRETILAEAYPALEAAAADRLTQVSFAGTKWIPTELGAEIDRLLMEQDRDERQLKIRREAMERLVKSVEDGSAAITQMQAKLVEAENEFQVLVVRREQAANENDLLDLVASAGRTGKTAAAEIGTNLDGLRTDVEKLEARNEARRDAAPAGDRDSSRLTQAWDRLARLKALNEKLTAGKNQNPAGQTGEATAENSEPASDSSSPAIEAAEKSANSTTSKVNDVIIVIKDAALNPAKVENQE